MDHARTGAPKGKRRSPGTCLVGATGVWGILHRATADLLSIRRSLRSYSTLINENERVQSATIVLYLLHEIHKLPTGLTYALVTVLVFGEAALFIGFVLPGETAVLVAGVAASQGHVNIVIVCVLVVAAAITGDSVGFEIGHRYGKQLMGLKILRKRRPALERALEGLRRRGPIYVFIGRFTAFMRAVMPGLAGMSRMNYRRFLVANAAGGLLWGVSYALLGYFAGTALTRIEKYASWLGLAILILMVLFFIVYHFVRKSRETNEDTQWLAEHGGDDSVESLE
jgi:membrane-associated protein